MLSDWVQAGGNLIAMRPDPQLAGLLGLTAPPARLCPTRYLKVDTAVRPGRRHRRPDDPVPRHGRPLHAQRRHRRSPRSTRTPTTATANPAVTLRSVGTNGGQAAAFTYDLARSVVYTRQGNPAWAGQRARRPVADQLIRSDDLFFGAKAGDVQPDWVDLNKVAIPQADEQQRLLANLIVQMNLDRKPLPRFWYLPARREGGRGDDRRRPRQRRHGRALRRSTRPTARRAARSPTGSACAAPPTSTRAPRSPTPQAAAFQSRGLRDRAARQHRLRRLDRQAQLEAFYASQLADLRGRLPEPACAGHQPHPLHRLERLGDASRRSSSSTASASTPTTTTGRGPGSRTARACSPARGCRCASPTSTAR